MFRQQRPDPVARPTLADASCVVAENMAGVTVGPLYFKFPNVGGVYVIGGHPVTTGCAAIDEGYVTAARMIALEVLKQELYRVGQSDEKPSETLRCEECSRVLAHPLLARDLPIGVSCGPVHFVMFRDGAELELHGNGSSLLKVAKS